jgi:hypothetical protein
MPNTKKKKLTSNYLETDKSHKDWFDSEVGMGKQRGKPKAVAANVKKKKGDFKKRGK